MQEILKSKRVWLTIASVIIAVSKDYLPLTPEQIQQIVLAIGAWVVGDSLRSTVPKAPSKGLYR